MNLLSGVDEVEIEGQATPPVPYDSTYIPAGVQHLCRNMGEQPMTILWICPTQSVNRTMIATEQTVEHLSDRDLMGSR